MERLEADVCVVGAGYAGLTAALRLTQAGRSKDGLELSLFSTVTTVGTPRDITVQELRIECFIPTDDASERAVESLASHSGPR